MGNSVYLTLTHIQRPFTTTTTRNVVQNAYDENMKKERVCIENAFDILKNR